MFYVAMLVVFVGVMSVVIDVACDFNMAASFSASAGFLWTYCSFVNHYYDQKVPKKLAIGWLYPYSLLMVSIFAGAVHIGQFNALYAGLGLVLYMVVEHLMAGSKYMPKKEPA